MVSKTITPLRLHADHTDLRKTTTIKLLTGNDWYIRWMLPLVGRGGPCEHTGRLSIYVLPLSAVVWFSLLHAWTNDPPRRFVVEWVHCWTNVLLFAIIYCTVFSFFTALLSSTCLCNQWRQLLVSWTYCHYIQCKLPRICADFNVKTIRLPFRDKLWNIHNSMVERRNTIWASCSTRHGLELLILFTTSVLEHVT